MVQIVRNGLGKVRTGLREKKFRRGNDFQRISIIMDDAIERHEKPSLGNFKKGEAKKKFDKLVKKLKEELIVFRAKLKSDEDIDLDKVEKTLLESGRNGNALHAAVASKILFERSKEVRIICDDMSGLISGYPVYRKAMTDFIERDGTSLKILFRDKLSIDSPVYKIFCLAKNIKDGSVELRRANEQVDKTLKMNFNKIVHMTLGDRKDYRLEIDLNKKKAEIVLDDKTGKINSLVDDFDKIFDASMTQELYCHLHY